MNVERERLNWRIQKTEDASRFQIESRSALLLPTARSDKQFFEFSSSEREHRCRENAG